jgi:hypothetical protein
MGSERRKPDFRSGTGPSMPDGRALREVDQCIRMKIEPGPPSNVPGKMNFRVRRILPQGWFNRYRPDANTGNEN